MTPRRSAARRRGLTCEAALAAAESVDFALGQIDQVSGQRLDAKLGLRERYMQVRIAQSFRTSPQRIHAAVKHFQLVEQHLDCPRRRSDHLRTLPAANLFQPFIERSDPKGAIPYPGRIRPAVRGDGSGESPHERSPASVPSTNRSSVLKDENAFAEAVADGLDGLAISG